MSAAQKKNNVISDALRAKGNKCFIKKEYFEALKLYNQALRYAELHTKQMGLAYANRSVVFLKVKLYKACLENIRLARENNLPSESLFKLTQREKECIVLMNAPAAEEPCNDFFKLTYQPNPNFPFLTDCLELKKHERGMFLSTNRDLKAGDIIAITEPIFRFPARSVHRCNYCLADQFMNFIPCSGCVDVMFCNEVCMKKAAAEFHQFECGITDNPSIPKHCLTALRMIMKCASICDDSPKQLKEFLPQTLDRFITPFDFQLDDPFSVPSQKKLLLAHFSENQRFDFLDNPNVQYSDVLPFLRRHPRLQKIVTHDLYKNVVNLVECCDMKIFKTIDCRILSEVNDQKGINFYVNYFGGAMEICYNLFLHSCAPTVFLHPYNGKIVWIVLAPIKSGDWLTVAYQNAFFSEKSYEDRKAELPSVLCCCQCIACTGNWKPISVFALAPIHVICRSSEEGITAYKKYCHEMNSEPLDGKCNEKMWYFIGLFLWNLLSIGRATF